MSGELSRVPLGLLGFFQVKNGGQNPQQLQPGLTPTMDLTPLYLNAAAQYLQVVTTISATGYLVLFQPPPNESWWLTDFSADIATGVGESWQGTLGRATPSNLAQVRLRDERSLAASQWLCMAAPNERPLILSSGENCGILTNAFAGVIDVVTQIRYIILPS